MPIRRFIINPPRNMTEDTVKEAAETMFAAIKGVDAGAPEETPLKPSQPVQDDAESDDTIKPAILQDEDEPHGDGNDADGDSDLT